MKERPEDTPTGANRNQSRSGDPVRPRNEPSIETLFAEIVRAVKSRWPGQANDFHLHMEIPFLELAPRLFWGRLGLQTPKPRILLETTVADRIGDDPYEVDERLNQANLAIDMAKAIRDAKTRTISVRTQADCPLELRALGRIVTGLVESHIEMLRCQYLADAVAASGGHWCGYRRTLTDLK